MQSQRQLSGTFNAEPSLGSMKHSRWRREIPFQEIQISSCYAERIGRQASGRKLSKAVGHSCALRKLNPILVDGVLRVGGQLERAPISFHTKHPMILPPKHHVTELVIRYYHHQEGHSGARQVLNTIQQKFWIIRGPAAVRRILGNVWTVGNEMRAHVSR